MFRITAKICLERGDQCINKSYGVSIVLSRGLFESEVFLSVVAVLL